MSQNTPDSGWGYLNMSYSDFFATFDPDFDKLLKESQISFQAKQLVTSHQQLFQLLSLLS